MIIGVISFTFVVSNINSILSQNNKKASEQSKNIIFLEKMKVKHGLSVELIEMAKNEIRNRNNQNKSLDFSEMINNYPANLKNELYFSMYSLKLKKIKFFKDLPPEVVAVLGQALTPIVYTKGHKNIFWYYKMFIHLTNFFLFF